LMPMTVLHRMEDLLDIAIWDAFVKKVRHRVHEDAARLSPCPSAALSEPARPRTARIKLRASYPLAWS
jgi:hypothetical protein